MFFILVVDLMNLVFELQVNGRYSELIFRVWDEDPMAPDDLLGYTALSIPELLSKKKKKG